MIIWSENPFLRFWSVKQTRLFSELAVWNSSDRFSAVIRARLSMKYGNMKPQRLTATDFRFWGLYESRNELVPDSDHINGSSRSGFRTRNVPLLKASDWLHSATGHTSR